MNPFFQHRFTRLIKADGAGPAQQGAPGEPPGRFMLAVVAGLFAGAAVVLPAALAVAMLLRGARLLPTGHGVGETLGGVLLLVCCAGMTRPALPRKGGGPAPPGAYPGRSDRAGPPTSKQGED